MLVFAPFFNKQQTNGVLNDHCIYIQNEHFCRIQSKIGTVNYGEIINNVQQFSCSFV